MNDVLQDQASTDQQQMSVDIAAEAILARWEVDADEAQPSKPDETEATPDIRETDQEETSDVEEVEDYETADADEDSDTDRLEDDAYDDDQDVETDEGEDETDEDEVLLAPDDAQVEVTVNGEVQTVSVGSLKRLAGVERSLTQKSQKVAEQRKVLDDAIGKNHVVFQKMLEKANERWKPFSEVDMLVAAKAMETDDFAALRKEAEDAYSELKFLNEEAEAFYTDIKNQQQAQLQEAAKQCVEVLQDEMPDWSNKLYNDIRTYAVEQGLPQEDVNNYTDPKVIMLLNKARLYDAGKKIATTKKKAATTKKTLRTSKAPDAPKQRKQAKMAEARAKLNNGGNDLDDIADALLSRWEA